MRSLLLLPPLLLTLIALPARADLASLRIDAKLIQQLGDELGAARATLERRKAALAEDIAAFNTTCNDSDSADCGAARAALRQRQDDVNAQIRAWRERRGEYLEQRRTFERDAREVSASLAGQAPADLAPPAPGLTTTFAASEGHILASGERRHVELKLIRAALAVAADQVAKAVVDGEAPVIVGVKLTRWWPDERAEWWAETPAVRQIRREEVGVEGSAVPPAMQVYAVETTEITTPAGSFTVGENGAENLKVTWPPSVPRLITSPVAAGVTASANELEISLAAGVPRWVPLGGAIKVYAKQKWKGGGK